MKDTIVQSAYDFLKAVADTAKAQLGQRPERIQRSTWMVPTTPGTMSSREFERKVFDAAAVSVIYQSYIHEDFPQQQSLGRALAAAGIPAQHIRYGFFLPLVHHWLELQEPFEFEEITISKVLNEFVEAVVEGRTVTRSRDAINHIDLAAGPIVIQEGISIRPVTHEELWEFGEGAYWPRRFPDFFSMPSEDWAILDIKLRHVTDERGSYEIARAIRGAALTALRLASAGQFEVVDLGLQSNYGMAAIGRRFSLRSMPQQLGLRGGAYVVTSEVAQCLKESWLRLRGIMESEGHYLRLPAQRLVDGGCREQVEDAIIDYAIGLEALLTAGITDELRYRFSLRGATVLAWDGGNKRDLFRELQEFYDIRSAIIHGGQVDRKRLSSVHSIGENALRQAWWWYFAKGVPTLMEATSMIDDRILD